MLGGDPPSGAKQIVYVDFDVLQPVRGRGWGSGSVVYLVYGWVNIEGRGRFQGVGVGVVNGGLGSGVEVVR